MYFFPLFSRSSSFLNVSKFFFVYLKLPNRNHVFLPFNTVYQWINFNIEPYRMAISTVEQPCLYNYVLMFVSWWLIRVWINWVEMNIWQESMYSQESMLCTCRLHTWAHLIYTFYIIPLIFNLIYSTIHFFSCLQFTNTLLLLLSLEHLHTYWVIRV